MNKRFINFLPILFSLVLILGVFLGVMLSRNNNGKTSNFVISLADDKYSKVSTILQHIEEQYVDTINSKAIIESAISSILEKLDPHSDYIKAEEFEEVNDPLLGSFDGIGIEFNIVNDTVVVVNPLTGGPSQTMGVLAGDRIIKVDGKSIAGIKITTIDVMKKLKGKKGTKVNVSLLRRGQNNLITLDITRGKIPTFSVDVAYMINKEVGYIKISKFSATTHQEFVKALQDLKKQNMKKCIIDVRGNGGGYLDAAINLADELLEKDKMIVYTQGRMRNKKEAFAKEGGNFEDGNVAILIDEWSASASEILAGAVQDNDRGIIVGRRSFGKGLVQEQIQLNDGSAFRLTVARYYTPSGRCIQRPYSNGTDDYYAELMKRYTDGELFSKDSVKFKDTVIYKTPKGKILHGGGGIMPDVFVPVDGGKESDYFYAIANKNHIYTFAFDYADKHRKTLSSQYKDAKEYVKGFKINSSIINELVDYCTAKGVKKDAVGLQKSLKEIELQLKAYIGRNIFGSQAFYPCINEKDKTISKAVEAL